jgi:hypothetical protein
MKARSIADIGLVKTNNKTSVSADIVCAGAVIGVAVYDRHGAGEDVTGLVDGRLTDEGTYYWKAALCDGRKVLPSLCEDYLVEEIYNALTHANNDNTFGEF